MKDYKASRQMVYTEYKRKNKPVISLDERKRQKDSLKSYKLNGDDAS